MAKSILALNFLVVCLSAVYLANPVVEASLCNSDDDCPGRGACCSFLYLTNGKGTCDSYGRYGYCCQIEPGNRPSFCPCDDGLVCSSEPIAGSTCEYTCQYPPKP